MTKSANLIASFISTFIEENGNKKLKEMWNDEVKEDFLKLINKELKKSSKVKKDKKPTDAPKGVRSAYIFFCMDERPKITEEFPDMPNKDKVRLMGERWNEAKEDEDVMEHYRKLAEEDKERAAKDKENYVPTEGEKKKKEKGKRSKTGYQLFCDDERESVKEDGFTGKEIMTELGRRWKALPEENEKKHLKYMEKAAKLKKKAEEEKVEEEPESDEEEKPKKKAAPKKKVAKKEESDDEEN